MYKTLRKIHQFMVVPPDAPPEQNTFAKVNETRETDESFVDRFCEVLPVCGSGHVIRAPSPRSISSTHRSL